MGSGRGRPHPSEQGALPSSTPRRGGLHTLPHAYAPASSLVAAGRSGPDTSYGKGFLPSQKGP